MVWQCKKHGRNCNKNHVGWAISATLNNGYTDSDFYKIKKKDLELVEWVD